MLTMLRINGFAVVDAVEVRFGPGLNVLTGETGAGKSLLVNALHLVLGGRMSAEVLREGADEAVVEALFELPAGHPVFARLEAAGVPRPEPICRAEGSSHRAGACPPPADEPPPNGGTDGIESGRTELLVRRVAARNGRGRAFVNGALCTVGMLEGALRGVADVSGQHEHVTLLDPASHLGLLDAFAGVDAPGGLLARYREEHGALAALVREERALAQDEGERARRADYLAFQLGELEAADPRPGEDAALEQERRVLASAARLGEAARAAEGLVYGEEGSAAEHIGQAVRSLAEAAQVDPRLGAPLGLLRSAAAEVEEAGRELARYAQAVEGDPERLAAVEERLDCLRALVRKHGGSLEAAIARRDEMKVELGQLDISGDRRAALAKEIADRGATAARLAGEMTEARSRAARAFCEAVQAELESLAMGRCRMEVAFAPPEGAIEVEGRSLGACGAERAEILIAPNPGEPPRPLGKIASGGELSRVLLAVKRAFSRVDPVATYVFDEVDAGIGGAVAEAMGRVLAEVSRGRQVLCVTHLPQVAAFADRHHRVEKRVAGGRTAAAVLSLESEEERRREVARMLAGVTVTTSALEHAASLIAAAQAPRPAAPARGRRAVRSAARLAETRR